MGAFDLVHLHEARVEDAERRGDGLSARGRHDLGVLGAGEGAEQRGLAGHRDAHESQAGSDRSVGHQVFAGREGWEGAKMNEATTPISYSRIIGIATTHMEITSGGAMNAAAIRLQRIARRWYLL